MNDHLEGHSRKVVSIATTVRYLFGDWLLPNRSRSEADDSTAYIEDLYQREIMIDVHQWLQHLHHHTLIYPIAA